MTSKDQLKVMRAGFIIVRKCYNEKHIKFKNKENLHWKIMESGFLSNAALDRKMNELLKQGLIIED